MYARPPPHFLSAFPRLPPDRRRRSRFRRLRCSLLPPCSARLHHWPVSQILSGGLTSVHWWLDVLPLGFIQLHLKSQFKLFIRLCRCMPRVPPSNCVFSPPFPGFDDLHFWMARLLFWSCIGEIDVLPVCSLSCFSCVFGSRRPGWLVMLVLPGQKF